ncbi:hypothetical protein ACL9RI_07960 [Janthinobacterium sp. Mn2066]|uniref:hypothetical protein n=1 Tax=Janthinobacterium sp. Mn2066 TaxID=3395264 RepID=UPI003BDAE37C
MENNSEGQKPNAMVEVAEFKGAVYGPAYLEAQELLLELSGFYEAGGFGNAKNFLDELSKIRDGDTQKLTEKLIEFDDAADQYHSPTERAQWEVNMKLALLCICRAYCVQAFRSENNSAKQWLNLVAANHHFGALVGFISGSQFKNQNSISVFSRKGTDKKHKENREMKKQVFDWCAKHMGEYKSMDKAAETIAGKLVPVAVRTARSWIGEWKKIQSPGKL